MSVALEFCHVAGGYRRFPVFDDISFAIQEGTFCAVIGPNGSGKTTLLRAATGLLDRVTGQVRLFGEDIHAMAAARRAQLVGVVPQTMETPMAFSVEEIVMMGRTRAMTRWCAPSKEDWRIVEQAMVYTDVVDMRDRPFPELSGGEKQRTVIAMVLAQRPKLILMDEATSHLDINHRLEIMQLVERLNKEQDVTIVMVSHDLNLAAEFCERLMLFDRGALVADGSPADVLTEDALRQVYRCNVRIRRDAVSGSVSVAPAPRLTPGRRSGHGVHVHVICGGGCGEEVLRRLGLCDYTVSCGVLNRGDSDASIARALEMDVSLEAPFSPVGTASLAQAKALADAADVVVVCSVPFGPGNVANLELAESALHNGKDVLLMSGTSARDYTPEKRAAAKVEQLLRDGAREWRGITDLLAMLPSAAGPAPRRGVME